MKEFTDTDSSRPVLTKEHACTFSPYRVVTRCRYGHVCMYYLYIIEASRQTTQLTQQDYGAQLTTGYKPLQLLQSHCSCTAVYAIALSNSCYVYTETTCLSNLSGLQGHLCQAIHHGFQDGGRRLRLRGDKLVGKVAGSGKQAQLCKHAHSWRKRSLHHLTLVQQRLP